MPLTKKGRTTAKSALRKKLRGVRLFLCDVDGVLTDGGVYMGSGAEWKRFHVMDGLGLRFLQRAGVRVGWVSRRRSAATVARARDLQVDYLVQVDGSKVEVVGGLLGRAGVGWSEVCYMGDDVVDLGVLKRAGVAVAVANGIDEVKAVADYVTRRKGGHGAVREVTDMILKARGCWSEVIRENSE